jgi:hypothetical protein
MTGLTLRPLALFASLLTFRAGGAERASLEQEDGEKGGSYRITGYFEVPAPRPLVWAVLTDYNGMQGMLPSLISSRVLARRGNRVLVKQRLLGHFLFMSGEAELNLRITEIPQTLIRFDDASGKTFEVYHGFWKLEDRMSGTHVDYALDVSSAVMAPVFLEKTLFQAEATSLLEALKAEVIRRALLKGSSFGKRISTP